MSSESIPRFKEQFSFFLDSTLRSYSVVFFSQKRVFGLLLLAATFLNPTTGWVGLFGLLCSNGLAYVLGFERGAIRKGYFGFNSLLLGLALSYFYAASWNLLLLIFLSSLLATLAASVLQNVFWHYFRLPALSLPFVITFSLAISAAVGFGHLELSRSSLSAESITTAVPWLDLFLKSLGSTFFQVNIASGAILLLGLLIYSRLALLLGLAGLTAGYFTHYLLGAYPEVLTEQYLGFNYVLTGIAVGGIFLVPSFGSLLLAMLSASASAVIMLSLKVLLPAYLPPTAIPFNLITLLVLYALKLRLFPSANLALSFSEVSSPEENLATHRANLKTFRRFGVELSLPFHGSWRVTQGFNGKLTHKEDWRFGVDFMVPGSDGKLYRNSGANLEDYFCYDVPVLAPAEGKVVFVKSDVPDNKVGKVNERDNWGNVVIIEHAYQFYSCVAHLREGSINVEVGETVKRGQVIGRCGNSGRSAFPHLHFQMQAIPNLGAPTVFFQFSNFIKASNGQKNFIPRGEPKDDDVVSNLPYTADYVDFFPYSFTQDLVYSLQGGEVQEETWSAEIDLYGNLMIKSNPLETRLYFTLANGVLSVKKLEGSRKTGLYHFGKLLTDVPFVAGEKLEWKTDEETDYALPRGSTLFLDLLSIFGVRFKFELENNLSSSQTSLKLVSKTSLKVKTPLGSFYPSRSERRFSYEFAQKMGLVRFSGDGVELNLLETKTQRGNT